jgi:uncharacterized phiE125 gp8 family phage protein
MAGSRSANAALPGHDEVIMPLQLITAPALEPVTLDEAKAHLKVDTDDDDSLISTLITACRTRAEWHTARAFVTQSWTLWRDGWPGAAADAGLPPALSAAPPAAIEIPLPPLQAVTTITTYALDDTATVLDPSLYQVDAASKPARVALKFGVVPPTGLRGMNAVEIAFTAGYGGAESDVPAPIREAILELVACVYANRGDTPSELPPAALALLAPYRVVKL